MSLSAKRDALFKWVGPISPREIWLFKLKGRSEIVIGTLEEAKAYTVGSQIGSNATQQLVATGFTSGQNLHLASDERQNLQMLLRGRVDLVAFNIAEMAYRLKQLVPPVSTDKVEKTYLLSDEYLYYFALSKEVSDSTIAEMQAALDAMKADGRYDIIWKKYME
jgi:polar amino acid transport system substrate-binding protein